MKGYRKRQLKGRKHEGNFNWKKKLGFKYIMRCWTLWKQIGNQTTMMKLQKQEKSLKKRSGLYLRENKLEKQQCLDCGGKWHGVHYDVCPYCNGIRLKSEVI